MMPSSKRSRFVAVLHGLLTIYLNYLRICYFKQKIESLEDRIMSHPLRQSPALEDEYKKFERKYVAHRFSGCCVSIAVHVKRAWRSTDQHGLVLDCVTGWS